MNRSDRPQKQADSEGKSNLGERVAMMLADTQMSSDVLR
jgi:hypothetical protein